EFLEGHAALDLQADVDDGEVLLDGNDPALDDRALGKVGLLEAFGEQGGKVLARRVGGNSGHSVSWSRRRLVLTGPPFIPVRSSGLPSRRRADAFGTINGTGSVPGKSSDRHKRQMGLCPERANPRVLVPLPRDLVDDGEGRTKRGFYIQV